LSAFTSLSEAEVFSPQTSSQIHHRNSKNFHKTRRVRLIINIRSSRLLTTFGTLSLKAPVIIKLRCNSHLKEFKKHMTAQRTRRTFTELQRFTYHHTQEHSSKSGAKISSTVHIGTSKLDELQAPWAKGRFISSNSGAKISSVAHVSTSQLDKLQAPSPNFKRFA
jgi:hypothetical protein